MTQNVFNNGFPVLAYPTCDIASPASLSLIFKYNESRGQATLCLQSSLFIHTREDAQTIILQYDADNIAPGKISLGPVTIPLPEERFRALVRGSNPQIRTLSLVLRKTCPVWCLPASKPLSPCPGHEAPFHQLAKLAQASELHIVFDHKWLHREHHPSFERLIKHPEQLSGFPVGQRYRQLKYECVDWLVFNTGDADTPAESSVTTEDEEPPPEYTERGKRSRAASTSPKLSSPLPKRVLRSPYLRGVSLSPTEQDSIKTQSPKSHQQTKLPSPAASSPKSPYTPSPPNLESITHVVPATDLERAVEKALESLLPSLLPRLLAAPSPTPSSSQQSIPSQISHAPPPPVLSALGLALSEHVTRRIKSHQDSIYAYTLSHANYLRNLADGEAEDILDEGRQQLLAEKQDVVDEMESAVNEKLQALRDGCDDIVGHAEEMAEQKADDVIDHTIERLGKLGYNLKVSLKEWENLQMDKAELNKDKGELRKDKEELRKDREELRKDKEELRKEKEQLKKEREELKEKKIPSG